MAREDFPVPAFPEEAAKLGEQQSNIIEATTAFEKLNDLLNGSELPSTEEIYAAINGTVPEAKFVIENKADLPRMNREMIKDAWKNIASNLEHAVLEGKIKNDPQVPVRADALAETFKSYLEQIEEN